MPIYEFLCGICKQRVALFFRTSAADNSTVCPHCGDSSLTRIFSGFAIHRSTASIHEGSGSPLGPVSQDYYKDPRNIGRNLEERLKGMGMDMPAEIKQNIEEARQGKLPDSLKELESASSDSAYH